ncbi:MAG TPA: methyltransferase domain-containing protein [Longimicrobium sp.]|nr:methyltransferase domain-containing protein [Longimicrobium sp.]
MSEDDRLREGAYARRQLFGGFKLLRWSHGSRFRVARQLVEPYAGARLLDYGCGDGTFLQMVHDLFPNVVGAEVDATLASEAAARYAAEPGLRFVHTGELGRETDGSFGVAVCMEVLEHCTSDAVDRVLADLGRLVAKDGTIIISVPVETGPALVGKQLYRALAARRGLEGYVERETYTSAELGKMLVAGGRTAIERPVYHSRFASGDPNVYHGHKGFNWRALRRRLARDFVVRRTLFSPVPLLGPLLNSQAWFVLSPRAGP